MVRTHPPPGCMWAPLKMKLGEVFRPFLKGLCVIYVAVVTASKTKETMSPYRMINITLSL